MADFTKKRLFSDNDSSSSGGGGGLAPVYNDLDPVISQLNNPPAHVSGERYLINTAPTGAWVGNANSIAESNGAAWTYTVPVSDDYVYVTSTLQTFRFDGTIWTPAPARAVLQNGNSFGPAGLRIGTNDTQATRILTNGLQRFYIDSSGRVKIGAGSISSSAKFQIDSTSQGFLAPVMTTAQKNLVSSPATGLLVFDSTLGAFNFYNGAAWTGITSSLADVLAVGNNMGGGTIQSIDTNTTFQISDNIISSSSSDGASTLCTAILDSSALPQVAFGLSDGTIIAEVLLDQTSGYFRWENATDSGRLTINGTELKLQHTLKITIDAPLVDMASLQTGNAGLTAGKLYVDTAANVLANGDLIVARKV